jgi:hypothetical protein
MSSGAHLRGWIILPVILTAFAGLYGLVRVPPPIEAVGRTPGGPETKIIISDRQR